MAIMSPQGGKTSLVYLTLLYNSWRTVIPAKAGIQVENDWIPDQVRNDKIGKSLLRHHTNGKGGNKWQRG